MLVNRIYFRGLKTFECVFMIPLFCVIQCGFAQTTQIHIDSTQVAHSPAIYDIAVFGVCDQGSVTIELPIRQGEEQTKIFAQYIENKTDTASHSARFLVNHSQGSQQTASVVVQVSIECSQHRSRKIEHQLATDSSGFIGTPDWAKGLVWYQVFPERFRDGNPKNNPNSWDVSPVDWDLGFDESTTDEIERGWNRRLVNSRAFSYPYSNRGGVITGLVFNRRYGGDLIGVYNKLESLRDQGITGIYLCPVFQSRSLHKYDADDHRHIDPTLGHPGEFVDPGPGNTKLGVHEDPSDESTWEWTAGDRWFIDVFLPKAKSLGMRVVLDGVWNHVGTDHFAFADVMEQGEQSPFVDWFDVHFDQDGKLFAWQAWGMVNGGLPVFEQTETGDLVAGPKSHVMAVTRRWMDPNGDGDPSDGIDGWRLDVANEIGAPFWKDWRAQVKELNPDALIIAEIWNDADRMLNDEAFDGQMNYPFAYAVSDWLSIGDTKGDARVCANRLNAVFHHHPRHDLVQFNLMTSHDTERLASLMHNDFQRGYDNGSKRWTPGTSYDADTVNQSDRDRALSAIATMVASPGSVMIYNGDEYAMPGADDPDNRRPIQWDQLNHPADSEVANEFNQVVSELSHLRSEPKFENILRFGQAEFSGDEGWLIVQRRFENEMIEFMIPGGSNAAADLPNWPDHGNVWIEQHESSRKFGMQAGGAKAHFRYLVRSD